MKKKRIGKILLGIVLVLLFCFIIFYNQIVNYLIGQAKNPSGIVGKFMTYIWNDYFDDMNAWGLEQIKLEDYDMILDVGCGGGATIKYMAGQNKTSKVYGIDISKEAIKTSTKVNKKYIKEGRVALEVADVADLPYDSESFSLVTAMQTHIYWDELKKGLSEIYRVLDDSGKLLITCEMDKIDYYTPMYSNPEDFKLLMNEVGFNEVDVKKQGNWITYICSK
ncbi:MAG: class I SAM-dependent methyltransferase [Clostridiales bacterium]|jgi:SAM-dependent methyltransferase|nr:class I SAM-dependent methyltransferase [Bacillota bacterium]NLK03824.1 class I SAM-dependent methyltransferase [Clostridiales bacterium]